MPTTYPEKKSTMLNRGALTILGIVLLGASMASVAVWYHAGTGRRCLEAWGVEGARLIRHAPQVEGLRLVVALDGGAEQPDGEDGSRPEHVQLGDRWYEVTERVDVSGARGLVHARHALIMDHNFDFDALTPDAAPDWTYAFRFSDGASTAVLALAPGVGAAGLFPRGAVAAPRAATLAAETAFLDREFARAKPPASDDR